MKKFLMFCFLVSLCVQCEDSVPEMPESLVEEYTSTTHYSFDEFSNQLNTSAVRLFIELCQSDPDDKNKIISPLSIQTAIALLLNGAYDNTAEELKQFLHLEKETIGGVNSHFEELLNKVLDVNTTLSYLNVNNAAIWNTDKIAMNQNFLDRVERTYAADLLDNDFTKEGINGWAEAATDGLIKEVIQEIKQDEVLFLLNALLFKGAWLAGFNEGSTQTHTAELDDGTTTEYQMMASDYNHYYYDNGEVQAVNMKFTDNEYEVIVIQPKEDPLDDFISQQGVQGLSDLLTLLSDDAFSYDRIIVQFPKFEVKYKRTINQTLHDLGVIDAFSYNDAALDSLGTAQGNLYVTRVLHDTYFKVDEKGVKGAAVTTVGVGTNSVPPIFSFDKPFFICLRMSENKIPIFMGKIGDPGVE